MKLWIGGEIQADIADAFRISRRTVESAINDVIADKSYDLAINSWDVIAIVRDDDSFDEVTRYSKRRLDMDYRLRIDYLRFRNGDDRERAALICEMLLRSLRLLRSTSLNASGLAELERDVSDVAVDKKWI